MERPGGYEPSDARSIRAGNTVAVADMEMQRTVTPPYVGSNPTSHLERDMERNPAMESTFAGF